MSNLEEKILEKVRAGCNSTSEVVAALRGKERPEIVNVTVLKMIHEGTLERGPHRTVQVPRKPMTLKDIKTKAKDEFGHDPRISGFGLGENHLIIYVNQSSISTELPKEYEGLRVEVVHVPNPSAQA